MQSFSASWCASRSRRRRSCMSWSSAVRQRFSSAVARTASSRAAMNSSSVYTLPVAGALGTVVAAGANAARAVICGFGVTAAAAAAMLAADAPLLLPSGVGGAGAPRFGVGMHDGGGWTCAPPGVDAAGPGVFVRATAVDAAAGVVGWIFLKGEWASPEPVALVRFSALGEIAAGAAEMLTGMPSNAATSCANVSEPAACVAQISLSFLTCSSTAWSVISTPGVRRISASTDAFLSRAAAFEAPIPVAISARLSLQKSARPATWATARRARAAASAIVGIGAERLFASTAWNSLACGTNATPLHAATATTNAHASLTIDERMSAH
eukprot:comp20469_c0_seq1/m.41251 comp20469_c0_seq1/g.41251  ORF comp20469_c0_seq1/g.41251 comp20469_c0_seq1/m.41251 type:complete len:325 (+) comp20469_c0_seq1:800-1774(+)